MGNRYPVLIKDSLGLQLYCNPWALSSSDSEALAKFFDHYGKNKFEYLGLLKSDNKLIKWDMAKPSFGTRLKWFFNSILRAFKANVLVGQEYEIHSDI